MGRGARKSLACLWRRQNQEGASRRQRFVSIPRAGKKLLEYLVFIVLFRGVWGRRCDQPHDVKCESHLRVKGTRQGVGSGELPDSRLRGRAALPEMGRGENRAGGQMWLELNGPSLSPLEFCRDKCAWETPQEFQPQDPRICPRIHPHPDCWEHSGSPEVGLEPSGLSQARGP